MGKTMEEELKKQEKKHSREEHQDKLETRVDIIETTEEKQETIETKEDKQEKILLKEEQKDNNMDSWEALRQENEVRSFTNKKMFTGEFWK